MIRYYKFRVEDKRTTVGKYLRKQGISKRALINCRHNGGFILVNKKRRMTSYAVKAGDVIHFVPGIEPENKKVKAVDKSLDILYEDELFLIINKPAGLLSTPSKSDLTDSVVNRLLSYFQTQSITTKPHVITRLDKDTSGCLLVAKDAIGHAFIQQSKLDKYYLALIQTDDQLQQIPAVIDRPIARVSGDAIKREVSTKGKESQTEYQLVQKGPNCSLVRLKLRTGRTHQIRVHLASLGYPLLGDQLYGGQTVDLKRQALHASQISFNHPLTQQKVKAQAPLPQDLALICQKEQIKTP
ncbi:RluA family pseudouridine synthase [Holzapfeliella sp. He02]|uniref:Pseudouridine synthase n=1 Tax=Holzapfeliella saturejae TaxID=3082953 RepID=A0ABU8SH39_9LACO